MLSDMFDFTSLSFLFQQLLEFNIKYYFRSFWMGSLFSTSRIDPKNRPINRGHKKPIHPRKSRFSIWKLATTIPLLVAQYQEYGILPTEKDGYPLKLVGIDEAKSQADLLNDGFKFRMVGKTSNPQFCTIRPILRKNSKQNMLLDYFMRYDIAIDTPHVQIAEKHGLVHDVFPPYAEPYKEVNNKPVTKLRSGCFQLVTAHAENEYWKKNKAGGPGEIVVLDAMTLGKKSKNNMVIICKNILIFC